MKVLGILMIIGGILLGLYVGVWVCFIGGVIDIVEVVQSETIVAMDVAFGLAKIVFAGAAGALSAYALIIPGFAIIASD